MSYTYASIVPLIGGETLAMEQVFGKRPEYILSYEPFANNDQHIVKHYNNEVPYHVLNITGQNDNYGYVDVVNTVCPCAGLSSLSPSANSDAAANDWMVTTSQYVLGTMQPRVFWGENAPRLASKMGRPVVEKLTKIGRDHGYTFSIYKTKSILHGLSQVRDRTFYFFWKEDGRVPLFKTYNRQHKTIEDTIRDVPFDPKDPMSDIPTKKKPSEDPYYKYILEVIHGGITHKEFAALIPRSFEVLSYIEDQGHDYKQVGAWMNEKGYEKEVAKCDARYEKLKAGGNIMRKGTTIPRDYIGAFVGHLPTMLTHPDEDRYLTIRESMEIMKLPRDMILQGGRRNLNHICQNVPVTTAADMGYNILDYLNGKTDFIYDSFYIQDNKKPEFEGNTLSDFF